jgi:hypothetical protein
MIALRGRAVKGEGEREIKIPQGVECYTPISAGVTLCLSFVNHSQPISPNSCVLLRADTHVAGSLILLLVTSDLPLRVH